MQAFSVSSAVQGKNWSKEKLNKYKQINGPISLFCVYPFFVQKQKQKIKEAT